MSYRIAFFSDFHLSDTDEDFNLAFSLIYDAVKSPGDVEADHVIIAGDIVDCAQIWVLEEFWDSLKKMNWSDSDQITIVPGNHDIFTWSKRPPFISLRKPTTNWGKFNQIFSKSRKGQYCRQLTKGEPYPYGKILDKNVSLVGLDSTRNGKYLPMHWASGQLMENDIVVAREFFSEYKAKHRIIVMHHRPWSKLEESESPIFPMGMAEPNRDTAIKWLKSTGASLILCGHYHTKYDVKKKKLGENMIGFSAGTAGGVDEDDDLRIYHVIDLYENGKIKIDEREFYPKELDKSYDENEKAELLDQAREKIDQAGEAAGEVVGHASEIAGEVIDQAGEVLKRLWNKF